MINSPDLVSGAEVEEHEELGHEHVVSPLTVDMPIETLIISETTRLLSDPNIHISDVATCISQDPVFVLELLKLANQGTTAQARSPVTIPQNAVMQLGSQRVLETTHTLSERPQISDREVAMYFEKLRSQGRRVSIVAKVFAMAINKELSGEAQTVGLMTSIGHMLACMVFGRRYVELANSMPRASVVYRLASEYHFDVRAKQLQYLQRHNFPEVLIFALDKESVSKSTARAPLRPIVEASIELVNAFDGGKLDKYRPEVGIPTSSAIRLLQLTEAQYQKIFVRCEEYLNATKLIDQQREAAAFGTSATEAAPVVEAPLPDEEETREDEETLLEMALRWVPGQLLYPQAPPMVFERLESPDKELESNFFRTSKTAQEIANQLDELFQGAKKPTDAVSALLGLLVERKLFARVAILSVSNEKRSAQVLLAAGDDLAPGASIDLTDPLCPIAACSTKVKSFNARGLAEDLSPFGVHSYAISPLDVRYHEPVVLYADCGKESAVTFEARRIFRYVLGYVNHKLPDLEGSLQLKAA